jgi:cell division protease FtsH
LLERINNNEIVSVLIDNNDAFYNDGDTYYKVPNYNKELDTVFKLNNLVQEQPKSSGVPFWIVIAIVGVIILGITLAIASVASIAEKASKEINLRSLKEHSTKKHNIVTERPNVTFNDVSGCKELKKSVQNDIECLKNPKLLQEMGARMPKGMVLYGPPGTGKTLIAKAIAGTAGVPFISASGSDFIEMYVGVGAKRVRDLYAKAREKAPCIVFIDEIDAVGGKRGTPNNNERDQTINALLTELDGFSGSEGILTICATNRLDMLDPALIRPGRFDKQLAVPLPDKSDRLAILKKHASNKKLSEDISLELLSEKTMGFSGADLEGLLNESALIAISLDHKYITKEDVENAFFRIVMKGDKKENTRSEFENKLVAYHEAGHALATKLLTDDDVPSVTIIGSTSGAGGVTFRSPQEKVVHSKKYLRNLVKVMYAGRAAEQLLLENDDEITTGASNDIKQATRLIKDYLGTYGMGENGMLAMDEFENTDRDILKEASKMAKTLYQETVDLLTENSLLLSKIADALIEKESIDGDELDDIINPKTVVIEFNVDDEEDENSEITANIG